MAPLRGPFALPKKARTIPTGCSWMVDKKSADKGPATKASRVTVEEVENPIGLDNETIAKLGGDDRAVREGPPVSVEHKEEQQSLTSIGQRKINLIWETTQAVMTVTIVLANVLLAFFPSNSENATYTLTNAMFVVLGFYYGRTNHQKVGGLQQGR